MGNLSSTPQSKEENKLLQNPVKNMNAERAAVQAGPVVKSQTNMNAERAAANAEQKIRQEQAARNLAEKSKQINQGVTGGRSKKSKRKRKKSVKKLVRR